MNEEEDKSIPYTRKTLNLVEIRKIVADAIAKGLIIPAEPTTNENEPTGEIRESGPESPEGSERSNPTTTHEYPTEPTTTEEGGKSPTASGEDPSQPEQD
jgi:hypothetical protein